MITESDGIIAHNEPEDCKFLQIFGITLDTHLLSQVPMGAYLSEPGKDSVAPVVNGIPLGVINLSDASGVRLLWKDKNKRLHQDRLDRLTSAPLALEKVRKLITTLEEDRKNAGNKYSALLADKDGRKKDIMAARGAWPEANTGDADEDDLEAAIQQDNEQLVNELGKVIEALDEKATKSAFAIADGIAWTGNIQETDADSIINEVLLRLQKAGTVQENWNKLVDELKDLPLIYIPK